MDLETALNRVIGYSGNSNIQRELISSRTFISFRVADSRDASSIASFYEKRREKITSDDLKNDISHEISSKPHDDVVAMELRLAQGLGDEDTPPSVFAILVDIHENGAGDNSSEFPVTTSASQSCVYSDQNVSNSMSKLVAAALFTAEWQNQQRILRVEWSKVDEHLKERDIVHRRLWFRLSAIALLAACQLMAGTSEEKLPPFRAISTLT